MLGVKSDDQERVHFCPTLLGNSMDYKDKFNMPEEEAIEQNEQCLKDALDALYATYVTSDIEAAHRGKAIQAINNIARMQGYHYLVRND